jgi:hypothetical protein
MAREAGRMTAAANYRCRTAVYADQYSVRGGRDWLTHCCTLGLIH